MCEFLVRTLICAVSSVDDECNHIVLDTESDIRLLLWQIQQRTSLLVTVTKFVNKAKYMPAVEDALDTIEQGMHCEIAVYLLTEDRANSFL